MVISWNDSFGNSSTRLHCLVEELPLTNRTATLPPVLITR